ncbi:MurR/RpiR family transcriptional regulator [Pseudactinotalea sp.]|uniref:MurR/RpiR family transcriptional regulator n=1 Tax=Pseudactinotalea sp. TaxID=1926260 RepID=UPI003B3ACB87
MSLQSQIQAAMETFPPSIRRVAEAVTDDPDLVIEGTISDLARRCDTSETTVVRFCRALGLAGYVQLRVRLARELGREGARRTPDPVVTDVPNGSLSELVHGIAFTERMGIEETVENLDLDELARVVDAVDGAGRIALYGVGASGASADDLQRKLFRIGRWAQAFVDPHDALTASGLLSAGDIAIGFSHRGQSHEVVAFFEQARAMGATTAAITNVAPSAVADAADLVLRTTVREARFRSGAMASRTAQLLIVDCLFVAVAGRRMDETVTALRGTYDAVKRVRDR